MSDAAATSSQLSNAAIVCSNADACHPAVACRNLLACQFGGGNPAAPAPLDSPLWSTGQAVVQHYRDSLPPIDPEYADSSKLRVSSEQVATSAAAAAPDIAVAVHIKCRCHVPCCSHSLHLVAC